MRPVRTLGRPTRLNVNVTLVRSGPIRSNLQEPEKDRKYHGPLVISTAQAPGGLNETYLVSMPRPLRATHQARTPTPGPAAPPTNLASLRNGSQSSRRS